MNLVFGSEVALLGFWEYMFRILFKVLATVQGGVEMWGGGGEQCSALEARYDTAL
jgi:hypothetical protein